MIERVVPMGSSFFGWGTMAMRPVAFLYLQWLPRCTTKWKPCCSSMRMTSDEPRRLGIDQLLANGNIADRRICGVGFAFKVEFHSFLQAIHRFLTSRSETGDVYI